ncbi:MAG: DNA polymerase III subunit beta [Thermodesulfobacteriota bacterium]
MLLEISREHLMDSLSKTVPLTERKSPLPILSHVLVETTGSLVSVTGTDLQVGLKITHECEVRSPGRLAVPGRKFFEICRELQSPSVSIELEESGRLKIEAGESKFKLSVMDGSDYPLWPSFEGVEMASMPAASLLLLIEKTVFASSTDESRISINSVLFENAGEKTRLVAADGHRLAMITEEVGLALETRKLIPRRNLTDLRRILEGIKGEISVGFDEKNLVMTAESLCMTARLVDADYPNYSAKLPKQIDKVIKANRLNLIQTVRRAATLTSERNKGVTLDFSPGRLEVVASHPDLGTARDVASVEYEGEGFSTIANAAYLLEALNVTDTEYVRLEFSPANTPIMIHPDGGKEYFSLVMPMKSKEND